MKVVIAVDDSPYSKHLLQAIRVRHWPAETQFKIITVVVPIDDEFRGPIESELGRNIQEIEHARKEHAVTICEKVRHHIEEAVQGAIVHFEVRTGCPEEQILEAATEWNADRVMLGARGHSACPHNLPGSVSRSVAAHARCHVEIIRESQPRDRAVAKAV